VKSKEVKTIRSAEESSKDNNGAKRFVLAVMLVMKN
jgi:hypothetical protein